MIQQLIGILAAACGNTRDLIKFPLTGKAKNDCSAWNSSSSTSLALHYVCLCHFGLILVNMGCQTGVPPMINLGNSESDVLRACKEVGVVPIEYDGAIGSDVPSVVYQIRSSNSPDALFLHFSQDPSDGTLTLNSLLIHVNWDRDRRLAKSARGDVIKSLVSIRPTEILTWVNTGKFQE